MTCIGEEDNDEEKKNMAANYTADHFQDIFFVLFAGSHTAALVKHI
jgi:hypothetical protein